MFQRPKIGETEEDLLEQQSKFLKAAGKDYQHAPVTSDVGKEGRPPDVLVDVKEKTSLNPYSSFCKSSNDANMGFPQPFVIDSFQLATKKGKKSLFAQQMEKKRKKVKSDENMDVQRETNEQINSLNEVEHAVLDKLQNGIHEENLKKMSQMTESEILEEQKKLLHTLDPSLVKFLKNRGKKKASEDVAKSENLTETTQGLQKDKMEEEMDVRNKLTNYLDSKWINMDFIEKEKLEWIGEIPDKKCLEPDQPYSARFNFKGELQPFATDIDVRNSLYHHGDEPERPGYTIQELYQLSRSQVLQQRILALNTLANLIRKTKLGYYDSCFDGQLLHKLMESDLFFLLRFSIDETALIPSSVFCLHNLLTNECDEFCLDKLLGVTNRDDQPVIFGDANSTSKEEEGELKDHVVIGCDVIRGVLRTDLLLRMAYILNRCTPTRETVVRVTNCAIRISRHSEEAAEKVVQTPNLLGAIYDRIRTDRPLHEGIKLLRIVSAYSEKMAKEIIQRYDVLYFVSFLVADENPDIPKKDFYLLKLETLYLWRNLLEWRMLSDEFLSWSPCLQRLLLFYTEKVDVGCENEFDFELFAAITSLLVTSVKRKIQLEPNVFGALRMCLEKWLTQLTNGREYNFSISKALGSILRCLAEIFKVFGVTERDLEFIRRIDGKLLGLFRSPVFADMAAALVRYSYLMLTEVVTRDPDNLPSLCTVYNGGQDFLKIVQPQSSLPFFMSLVRYLRRVYLISNEFSSTLTSLLTSPHVRNYIKKVVKCKVEESKWFARYELQLVTDLMRLMYLTKDSEVLAVCFRLLPMLRTDDVRSKKVFQVICDKRTWGVEDEFFDNLQLCYSEMLPARKTIPVKYKCDLIPEEWPYKILLKLRSKENVACIVTVFRFLQLLLNRKPEVLMRISHTFRFYYLCYVFLTDAYVFDETVQVLVADLFRDVVEKANELRLDIKLDKNKSFYDLYTELITQYAGVSYGLPVFAQFVLLPLQNGQDVSFRKLLWFEYLHVLRVITLPFPVAGFVPVSAFVEPCETDESLLVAYLNSTCNGVITKVRNPFVYHVAVGNLKNFITSDVQDEKLLNFIKRKIDNLGNCQLKEDIMNFCIK